MPARLNAAYESRTAHRQVVKSAVVDVKGGRRCKRSVRLLAMRVDASMDEIGKRSQESRLRAGGQRDAANAGVVTAGSDQVHQRIDVPERQVAIGADRQDACLGPLAGRPALDGCEHMSRLLTL